MRQVTVTEHLLLHQTQGFSLDEIRSLMRLDQDGAVQDPEQ